MILTPYWLLRQDSNLRIDESKSPVLPLHHGAMIIILFLKWCGKQDLNLHELGSSVSKTDAAAITPFPHMVELTGVEPVSKKSLLTTNLILTLQVLCISFYLYFLLYTNLKSKF